jgi:hypothetical protein
VVTFGLCVMLFHLANAAPPRPSKVIEQQLSCALGVGRRSVQCSGGALGTLHTTREGSTTISP